MAAALAALGSATGCGRGSQAAQVNAPQNILQAALNQPPAPGAPLPTWPPTTDPNIAVQRMVAAYRTADSLQLVTESDGMQIHPAQVHQTTVLKYRKQPPQLAMEVKDPLSGTIRYIADGSSIVYYYGLDNRFMRRDHRGDLPSLCAMIDRDVPQCMSPIVFLKSSRIPEGFDALTMAGTASVNGKSAYVLRGRFTPAYVRSLGTLLFKKSLKPGTSAFTLWLDRSNYLLLKSSILISWEGVARMGEVSVKNPRIAMIEKTTQIIPNPRFSDDDFRFFAPKGAKEIFIERRGQ